MLTDLVALICLIVILSTTNINSLSKKSLNKLNDGCYPFIIAYIQTTESSSYAWEYSEIFTETNYIDILQLTLKLSILTSTLKAFSFSHPFHLWFP